MSDPYLPFWRLYGLAVKAGRAISGAQAVEAALKRNRGKLLLLAADMSPASKDRFAYLAQSRTVTVLEVSDQDTMGHWTGKAKRAVALITDAGFANRLMELAKTANGQKE